MSLNFEHSIPPNEWTPWQISQWEDHASPCPYCGDDVTNKAYSKPTSLHFKATCKPRWEKDRETFEWELKNHRPRLADWRWAAPGSSMAARMYDKPLKPHYRSIEYAREKAITTYADLRKWWKLPAVGEIQKSKGRAAKTLKKMGVAV